MHQDDAGGGFTDGGSEDFPWMRQGGGERPDRDGLLGDQLMSGIQEEGDQVFFFLVPYFDRLGRDV